MSVLLIQHQGATILEGDNAQFGTITDLGGAGRYEINRIEAIEADELILARAPRYAYSIAGTTQIIGVTPLTNATVAADLSPLPFDGRRGGVLFLDVTDTLRLEAVLRAAERGFRGGVGELDPDENCTFLSNRNDYFYGANDERAASKGEGVAKFIPGKEAGRGPQANGGGGGNAHNSGGGGGAHVTIAGQGGENQEPSAFGCDGDYPGLSGRALPATDTLLFFGGGGGAGHANNAAIAAGGNGGGIVVIRTKILVFGPGGAIDVSGQTAATLDGDGAGGGGAGGGIRLQYDTLLGTPQLLATGGNGGDVDVNGGNRCQGPGGGGSGGWVGATTLLPATLAGGAAGRVLESPACPNGNTSPQSGATGSSVLIGKPLPIGLDTLTPGFTFTVTDLTVAFVDTTAGSPASWLWDFGDGTTSTEQNPTHTYAVAGTYPVTLTAANVCAAEPVVQEIDLTGEPPLPPTAGFTTENPTGCAPFTVQFANTSVGASGFQWQFPGGEPATSQATDPTVTYAAPGQYDVTLISTNETGSDTLLLAQYITVGTAPLAAFTFAIDDQTVTFDAGGSQGTDFEWRFGDGQQADGPTPTHTYPLDTVYQAMLIVSTVCGSDTLTQSIDLRPPPPVAAFTADVQTGCGALTVQFTAQASDAATYRWSFSGGQPATATEPDPSVLYTEPGVYPVTLVVGNTAGEDSLTLSEYIVLNAAPTADFEPVLTGGLTVSFDNTSAEATSFSWQFGDGSGSSEAAPEYTYDRCGTYRVQLIAESESCGADTTFRDIVLDGCPTADFTQTFTSGCAPLAVQFANASTGDYEQLSWSFPGGEPASSAEADPLVLFTQPGTYTVTLTLLSAFGEQTHTQDIQVTAPPQPVFDYTVSGLTITLINQTPEADSYSWDFGDGASTNGPNPVHTYATGGLYTVTLNAQLGSCGRAVSRNVSVGSTSAEELARAGIRVYPNPVDERLAVTGFPGGTLFLFTVDGRLVRQLTDTGETALLYRDGLPAGWYWLRLVRGGEVYGLPILLR